MKVIYIADDGKHFDTEEGCRTYEEKVNKEKLEEEKRRKYKEKRYGEVKDAYSKYQNLVKKYYQDYPEDDHTFDSFDRLLRSLF